MANACTTNEKKYDLSLLEKLSDVQWNIAGNN